LVFLENAQLFLTANYGMNKSKVKKISLSRPIALIGMMGAGKTSTGRVLAELLDIPFYDSDAEIVALAGCSIDRIFSERGEAEFRRMERATIGRLLDRSACVLSLGGGAFMNAQTRDEIKKKAFSVWLKVNKDTLFKRIKKSGLRPLLKCDNPQKKFEQLLSEREPIYAEADLAVLCDDRPILENAQQIMVAIQSVL